MTRDTEHITLEDLEIPGIGGEQKESVLELLRQICSGVLLISNKKFEVGIAMARLYDIAGHGSFEPLRKRFFPKVPRRSAQRWTAVGREFGSYQEYVLDIGFSYLGKLAEQEVLSQIKSELIGQIKQGKKADGHYYRTKIAELLREEDKLEEIGSGAVGDGKSESDKSQRDSNAKVNVKKYQIDEHSMNVVDGCIPLDPNQLQALWNVLTMEKGKRVVTDYLYKRVGELIRNRMAQPSDEAEEAEHDSLEPA